MAYSFNFFAETSKMGNNIKNPVLQKIGEIYEAAEKCKLNNEIFYRLDKVLFYVSEKLEMTKEQALFFSVLLAMDLDQEGVSYRDLSHYFGCNPLEVINFSADFKALQERELIGTRRVNSFSRKKSSEEFFITEHIKEAVINNIFPLRIKKSLPDTITSLLETFYNDACQCDEEHINSTMLWLKTSRLLKQNEHFILVQKVQDPELKLSPGEKILLLYIFWKTLSGNQSVDLVRTVEGIVTGKAHRIDFIQKIISGECSLISNGLLEVEKAGFLNESFLKLTGEGAAILEAEGLKVLDKKGTEGYLQPEKIAQKTLYFNPSEEKDIEMLELTLQDEKLKEIQSRLKEKKLPVGVIAILYGPPGTGKTESVYQIARKTNRQIFKLEISETKSKWFGDSEKNIKEIFSRYKKSLKACDKLPILLFNEADAILSKRKDISTGNLTQTENAIQNILLEELENFEGIFIGTTNLITNLDPAFERRFLFKIEYKKPESTVKQKIWKSRLPSISPSEALTLATRFDFSGGQIENICRKILIQEVLNPEAISFDQILEFCEDERFDTPAMRIIGFGKG